eukprot:365226-Chlamydomonas_euryale.AAC.11
MLPDLCAQPAQQCFGIGPGKGLALEAETAGCYLVFVEGPRINMQQHVLAGWQEWRPCKCLPPPMCTNGQGRSMCTDIFEVEKAMYEQLKKIVDLHPRVFIRCVLYPQTCVVLFDRSAPVQ